METKQNAAVSITAPNFKRVVFTIEGEAPLVISKFSSRIADEMRAKHEAGSTAKKGAKKGAKDFAKCCEEATYRDDKAGWCGINASAFRCAMISACRLVGFKMTLAKLSVSVENDGWCGPTPLVRIDAPEPEMFIATTRNATGVVDLRARPMWKAGWRAEVRVKFDADQFTVQDVTNLMMRVGMQVGICEGRPDSKSSAGQGWGVFRLVTHEEQERAHDEKEKGLSEEAKKARADKKRGLVV